MLNFWTNPKTLADAEKRFVEAKNWLDAVHIKIGLEMDNRSTQERYNRLMSVGVEKENKQMTREEAMEKCFATLAGEKMKAGDIVVRQLINMLEALGLIKFEEEKIITKTDDAIVVGKMDNLNHMLGIIGYKIVKK